MDKAVRAYLSRIGSKGGAVGGKARTPAKLKSGRRNVAKARKFLVTKKLCRVCQRRRLAARNTSGICRKCQRKGTGVLDVRGKGRKKF